MSKRSQFLLALSSAITLALSAASWAAPPENNSPQAASGPKAQMAVFQKASGEKCFALSLMPTVKVDPAEARDLVVLFDTSASQNGPYRTDAINAFKVLLSNLGENDRVKLLAVDLDAVPMNRKFAAPASMQMKVALSKLERRVPLGSTDMAKALEGAKDAFDDDSKNPRTVIYIGDGVSNANWVANGEFAALARQLVQSRISVSSLAVGPRRDVALMAALANQTGGVILLDNNDDHAADNAGVAMSHIVRGTVFWPQEVNLPKSMQEVFPKTVPPLRSDRDTILIGVLDDKAAGSQKISMTAQALGNDVEMNWSARPVRAGDDLSFLPKLLDIARKDQGASLPTLGTAGLKEVGHMLLSEARKLSELGSRALASGDVTGASKLADAALASDPGNPKALAIRKAIKSGDAGKGAGNGTDLRLINFQAAGDPADEGDGSLLREIEEAAPGAFLDSLESQKAAIVAKVKSEVQEGLKAARDLMKEDPARVKDDLVRMLDDVRKVRELDGGTRKVLRNKIETAIRQASVEQIHKEQRDKELLESQAVALERLRLVEENARKAEKIKQLTDRFNSLMLEERYKEADEQIGSQIQELEKDNPQSEGIRWNARFAGNVVKMAQLREVRHRAFVDTLYRVEAAHVPFPDEPPIVYPDAEVWEELTLRRKKYASVDLSNPDGAESRIFAALDNDTSIDFVETPLSEVVEFLQEEHKIPIILDTKELETVGAGSDTTVTRTLSGISLRSALRLLLKEHDLTYVVKDEVLQITSIDAASTQMVTKVYPVGDLVLPISNQAGANPFMLGGGLGGQGGFGGGLGMGGMMGGGFGGMMGGGFGGGMMGGGFFAVEDDLSLSGKKSTTPAEQPAKKPTAERPRVKRKGQGVVPRRIPVEIKDGMTAHDAWNQFFSSRTTTKVLRADLRETARELWREKKYDQIVAMIQSALRHGQPQPWMYDAMVTALQAQEAPQSEIERALMSAVDFSDNADDLMFTATYLAKLGFDRRALRLFQDISAVNKARPEPYIQGLEAAKRLNDLSGIQWACVGILGQAWPAQQRDVESRARYAAIATLQRLRREQRNKEADVFQTALDKAMIRDCIVKVSWTGDADIDVLVEGPDGTVCSFRNPRTSGGGVMLGDNFSAPGKATTDGFNETYVCPQGFNGEYRVLLRRVWGKVTGGKVTIDIYTNRHTKKQRHLHKQIDLGEKDALVKFDVKNGRRSQPIAEQQIANAIRTQSAISRAVLMQQVNSLSNSKAVADYAVDRNEAIRDGRLGPRRRGRPGYRPVITTLPEGTNMTATAVVSADRRYVRITATPLFSIIGPVSTFNFSTGQAEDGDMDMDMDMDM